MRIVAVNDIKNINDDRQEGDEIEIGANLAVAHAPNCCVFRPDGSMVMLMNYPFTALDESVFPDASSEDFVKYVNEPLITGEIPSGDPRYCDIKIVSASGAGRACYIDLNAQTGRVAKYAIGKNVD